MRRHRVKITSALFCVIIVAAALWPRGTEVERLQAQTLEAAHKIQRLNNWNGSTRDAPVLALEFLVRGYFSKNDFRSQYYGEVDSGIYRLCELGVLEKKTFTIDDTNTRLQFVESVSKMGSNVLWRVLNISNGTKWFGGFAQDNLWHLIVETNGTVTITATPDEMAKWARLIENSAQTNFNVGSIRER